VGEWATRKAELEGLITQNAHKARDLDPDIGIAHTVLAVQNFYNWRAAEANAGFKLAYKLTPDDVQVLYWYSLFEYARDNCKHSVELMRRAVSLDPNNAELYLMLGFSLWMDGHPMAGLEALETGINVNPGAPTLHLFNAAINLSLEKNSEALESLRVADKLMPDEATPGIRAHVAAYYGRLGEHAEAERIFNEIEVAAKRRYVDPCTWGLANIAIGNYDRGLELYRESKRDVSIIQDPWIIHHIQKNTCSDPIIDEPRFQGVLSGYWVTE